MHAVPLFVLSCGPVVYGHEFYANALILPGTVTDLAEAILAVHFCLMGRGLWRLPWLQIAGTPGKKVPHKDEKAEVQPVDAATYTYICTSPFWKQRVFAVPIQSGS